MKIEEEKRNIRDIITIKNVLNNLINSVEELEVSMKKLFWSF